MTTSLHHVSFGSGTPILLVHGFTVDHRLLLPFERCFGDTDQWQRIYVDLPGFGRSPGADVASTDDVADRLDAFVDDVVGAAPFALVGNSWGAIVARLVLARRREQVVGLGLLCPAVLPRGRRTLPPRSVLRRDPDLIATLTADDAGEYTDVAVLESAGNWVAFRDHALPGLQVHDRAAAARIQQAFAPAVEPESRFATFDGPSWMVTARQDHVVGFVDQESILSSYPRMTSLILDGAGHNAHLDRPEPVRAVFRDWLDRLGAR